MAEKKGKLRKANLEYGSLITNQSLYHKLYEEGSENQLTKALLHILSAGKTDIIFSLLLYLGLDVPEIRMEISTQRSINIKGEKAILDGLVQIKPFNLIIESKLGANIGSNQKKKLLNLLEEYREKGLPSVLLYITNDAQKPEELKSEEDIIWASWSDIYNFLKQYVSNKEYLITLFEAFEGTYPNNNIIDKEKLTVIVAANKTLQNIQQHGIYYCDSSANLRGAKYLAVYANKMISSVYRIIEEIEDSSIYTTYPFIKPTDMVFRLEKIDGIIGSPIINDKKDKNQNITPFTMGRQRFCSIDDLQDISRTSQLEERMNKYK